jgi:hypothetical protein
MPGRTSRRWLATSSSAGSKMPNRTRPESGASAGHVKSWRKACVALAAGQGARTASGQAGPDRPFPECGPPWSRRYAWKAVSAGGEGPRANQLGIAARGQAGTQAGCGDQRRGVRPAKGRSASSQRTDNRIGPCRFAGLAESDLIRSALFSTSSLMSASNLRGQWWGYLAGPPLTPPSRQATPVRASGSTLSRLDVQYGARTDPMRRSTDPRAEATDP